MVATHVNKKNAGKPRVLAINALLHLPAALAANLNAEFDVSGTRPPLGGLCDPSSKGYPVWQTGLLALACHPTYHVNVIKLKWDIIWIGGLPHLRGLPHLPRVPPSPCKQALISPIQTTWYSPGNLPFVFSLIMHTYTRGCMCVRRHLKETVFWGPITWSERENKTYKLKRAIGKMAL